MSALVGSGAASRRASRYEPLRSLALAVSTVALILGLVGTAAVLATYDGWRDRSWDRSIRPADFHPDEEAAFLWRHVLEYTADHRPYSVVYIRRLADDAVPPPGLNRWPADGEVVASPATTGLAGRYGSVTGVVRGAGLLEPHELLVYVGAGELLTASNAQLGTGWGSLYGEQVGAQTYQRPVAPLLALLGVLVVAPAGWFMIASLRVGAAQRARRVDTLTVLGARRRHIRAVLWGESRVALVTAWCVAGALTALAVARGVPLPGLGFDVQAGDLRAGWRGIVVALVVGVLVSLGGALSSYGLKGERRRRDRRLPRASVVRAATAPVAAALTVVAVNLTIAGGSVEVVPLVFGLGLVVTLVSLPSSTRSWLTLAARRARERAWHSGRAGSLTGAAQVAAAPAPAARFGSTAAVVIILVSFMFSFAQALGGANDDARALRAQAGDDVAELAAWPQATDDDWLRALAAVAADHAVVQVREEPDLTSVLVGAQADLQRLGVAEKGSAPPAWVRAVLGGDYVVRPGDLRPPTDATPLRLLVARKDGGPVDLEATKDLLARATVPTWNVELPGDSWVVGTRVGLQDSRWVSCLGGAGVLLALLALWVGYSDELRRTARSMLAVQVLAPDRRFVAEALAWRIVAPVAVAVVGGSGLALVLVWPLTAADYELPVGFVVFAAAAALTTGAVALAAAVHACTRAARRLSFGVPEE